MTTPTLSRLLAPAILALAATTACTTPQSVSEKAPKAAAGEKEHDVQIIMDADKVAPELMPVWAGYGMSKSATWSVGIEAGEPLPMDSFLGELTARKAALDIYLEMGAKDPYFDFLKAVHDKGFLEEYIILGLGRTGWTIPASSLANIDLEGFYDWAIKHLQGHQVITGVDVRVGDETMQYPRPFGADLMDPKSLLKAGEKMPCSAMRELGEAFSHWRRESKGIPGAAVAAAGRQEFLNAAAHLKSTMPYAKKGITWVDPKAVDVLWTVAFCAVEHKDVSLAHEALTSLIEISPAVTIFRLELAHVHILQKEFPKALIQVQAVLEMSKDPCRVAMAWRKAGYIYFEQADWQNAQRAYHTSLEYDPGNKIALSELRLIEQKMTSTDPKQNKPTDATQSAPVQTIGTCGGEG